LLYGLQQKAPDPAKWRVFDPASTPSRRHFPCARTLELRQFRQFHHRRAVRGRTWQELYQKYFVPTGLPKELDDTLRFLLRFNAWG
jgi:hypothetical protein